MSHFIRRTVFAAAMSIIMPALPAAAETDDNHDPVLVLTGNSFVTIMRPTQIPAGGAYYDAAIWEWDARMSASNMGLTADRMQYIDEAKVVDNGKKVLVTSSDHWAALVDYETKKPVFYSTSCNNAHSAEMLPNNRLVVACSSDNGSLQVYDIDKSNQVLFSTPLPNGHGAVWIESRQRLYANGGQKLNIYKLKNWDTDAPELELETSIKTPKKGTHDLTMVDDNTLLISGRGCYFFDIDSEKFTELPFFSEQKAIKSTNYNPETGEMWYTDATVAEGKYSWSTQTVHHTYDPANGPDHCTFKTKGLDLYKVRVLDWGHNSAGTPKIEADATSNQPVEWFNMQGMQVQHPSAGLHIRRQGNNISKVVVKD